MTTSIDPSSFLIHSAIGPRPGIHAAIKKGDLDEVQIILRQEKGQIDAFDDNGLTPLLLAIKEDQTDIALLLIELGANVALQSKKGTSPLLFATFKNDLPLAKAILEKQPQEVHIFRISDGITSLHLAMQNRKIGMVELLCSYGANIHIPDKSGITPCQLLLEREGQGWLLEISPALLNLLHKEGAFSTQDLPFKALMQTSLIGLESLEQLVRNIDLEVRDPIGKTWVEIVLQNYDPSNPAALIILRLLFEKGAAFPSQIPPEWEKALSSLITSREDTFCLLLEQIDIENESWKYAFLSDFEERLTDDQIYNLFLLDKTNDYFLLMESKSNNQFTNRISNIILKHKTNRFFICNKIIEQTPAQFQESLIRNLLERGLDPLSQFSNQDPRCCLRIYLDFQKPDKLFFSPYLTSFLSHFLSLSRDDVKNAFDGMGLLEYLHNKNLCSKTLIHFHFALQCIGVSNGNFFSNLNDASPRFFKDGGSNLTSFPYIAIYAEKFLENMPDIGLSNEDKKNILKELLDSLDCENLKHQKKGLTLIPTGFREHSMPVLFFESSYGPMRAVANRGGGKLAKSLTIHAIDLKRLSNDSLSRTRRLHGLSENENREYLYRTSLQQLDANGFLPITQYFSDIFNRKNQKHGNCFLVAAKTSLELLMAAKVMQLGKNDTEARLKEVSIQYKWFSLFLAIAVMNDLYSFQYIDLDAEQNLREKVLAKYEKTIARFGPPSPFIQEQFALFLENSETFRKAIPAPLLEQHLSKMQMEEAIRQGDLKGVQQHLLSNPNSLNEKNCYGNTPLQIAQLHNQTEIAEWLCQVPGIDFSSENTNDETALLIAIKQNCLPVIDWILKVSPDIHISYNYFAFAFNAGNKELLDKFLNYGTDPGKILRAISWRILRKHPNLFAYLLDACSPKSREKTFKLLIENKLFERILDDLDVQGYHDQNYPNFEEVQARYLKDLQFLYSLGMRWDHFLEKNARDAFGLSPHSQSELLEFIRSIST